MKAFSNWRKNRKFRKAGKGHRLGDAPTPSTSSTSSTSTSTSTSQPTGDAVHTKPVTTAAGAAALARLAPPPSSSSSSSSSSSKTKSLSLAERRRARAEASLSRCPLCKADVASNTLRVHIAGCAESGGGGGGGKDEEEEGKERRRALEAELGIVYVCPVCDARVAREEIRVHLEECCLGLLEETPDDFEASATLMLTAKPRQVRDACVTTVLKYIDNILAHPDDPKYRRIKTSNKVFSSRVAPVPGALPFFAAIGFEETPPRETDKDQSATYLSLEDGFPLEALEYLREGLASASLKLKPSLDRAVSIAAPGDLQTDIPELDQEFFERTPEEIAAQAAAARAEIEESRVFKLRSGESSTSSPLIPFTRVKFAVGPARTLVEANFAHAEPASALFTFLASHLSDPSVQYGLLFPPDRRIISLDDVSSSKIRDLSLGLRASVVVTGTNPDGDQPHVHSSPH